jgi:hypothetical protein
MSNNQWRVGHTGRDMMYYEEMHDGEWQRIAIDGEMLTGRAHHIIYFADEATWRRYPEWARDRREEIITRIKSRFTEPDYEYSGGGTASSAVSTPPPATATPPPSQPANPRLPANDGSILPALAFLIVIAAACFWFAARGLRSGEIRLPAKHGAANRMVSRSEKPALFWTSFGLLAGLGSASLTAAGWLVAMRDKGHR